jgi:hypothetical protein
MIYLSFSNTRFIILMFFISLLKRTCEKWDRRRGHGLDRSGAGQGQVVGSCECGNEPSGSRKIRGISWLTEDLLTCQEGLCYMDLVTLFLK